MNVYIREVAIEMARRGVRSDIFTRRTDPDEPDVGELVPGVRVFSVPAGPLRPVHKDLLPRLVRRFTDAVDEIGHGGTVRRDPRALLVVRGRRLAPEETVGRPARRVVPHARARQGRREPW